MKPNRGRAKAHLLKAWLFHRSDSCTAGKDWPELDSPRGHFFGGLWLLHHTLGSLLQEETPL